MKNKKMFWNLRPYRIFDPAYEGEDGDDKGGDDKGGDDKGGDDKGGDDKGGTAKTFTEDQVNTIVKERLARAQKDTAGLSTRVEDLTSKVQMSQQDKDEIAKQLEDANNRFKTAEQIGEEKAKKAETDHASAIELANGETDRYKVLYESNIIDQAINSSMSEFEAMPGPALPAILGPMTEVKETVDAEGKPTGTMAPVVSFPTVDEEKNPVMLDLSVRDAVKRMSEEEQYGNLFKGKGTGGVGGGTVGGGRVGPEDITNMTTAEYQKRRKENKLAHQNQ